jgi:peptidyl-prolyl cis-trans isomerase C
VFFGTGSAGFRDMTIVRKFRLSGAVLALTALALLAPVTAAPAAPDDVLAKVDGNTITESDLDVAVEDLAGSLQSMTDEQKREYVLGYLIDLKLLAKAAENDALADSDEFKRKLAYLRDKALMEAHLTAAGAKAATEEAARKLYDETIKGLKPEVEVRARHILTETEEEAKAAYEKIKAGADFATVAKETSKDPGSAESGGDLGFFGKDQMVPAFADAAFKLEPGQVSEPVKSDFGWHVIKAEERREKPVPTYEQVKPQITSFVQRRAQQEEIMKLRSAAKIERTEAPKAPAAPAPAETPAAPAPAPAQ